MNCLIVGSRIHCILYGGKDGVIYAIHGEQKPETVSSIASVIVAGGNAEFDIVWKNGTESRRVPEAVIHGVQWRVLPGTATAEEIDSLRAHAAREQLRREREARETRERFLAEVDALKREPRYVYLEQGDDQHSGKLAAKNIRLELKRAFTDIKFSVRKQHHGSVTVTWRDGPTTKEVESITNKYKSGSFNGTVDIYESAISPWNTVFGGSQYISCDRSYSFDFLQSAVRVVSTQHGITPVTVQTSESGEAYLTRWHLAETRLVYDYLEMKGAYAQPAEGDSSEDPAIPPTRPDAC